MKMYLIAAVSASWGLGKDGDLLFHAKRDMQFFKETTMGHTVVMGRRTFESLPGGALDGRRNIVLTGDGTYTAEGIEVYTSVDAILNAVRDDDTVFIIGGQTVYEQFLPLCDTAYITRFSLDADADCFLHGIDGSEEWVVAEVSEKHAFRDGYFEFMTYVRK